MKWLVVALALVQPVAALSQSRQGQTGETKEISVPGTTYSGGRHAWVYTPPGYPASCQSACDLMVVFDGAQYLGAIPLPQILDSLIAAKRTPPTVAILIDNGESSERLQDLANSQRFAGFLANELLPWAWKNYAVTHSPDRTMLAGASAGGLGAAYVAFKYPALFGAVLSQSGAFWRGNEASNAPPYEWLTAQYAASPKVNVRFFMDVGSRETVGALRGAAPSILAANQRLHRVLEAKGYAIEYFEVPNGVHSPESWRPRFPVGIVALTTRGNR